MSGHRKWSEVEPSAGSYSLLPAGVRNYTIVGATAAVRERDQKRIVRLNLASEEGNGTHEVTLDPWSGDPTAYAQYENMLRTWLTFVGFEPVGDPTLSQAADQFAQRCASVVGAIVELNVKHVDSEKDGKVYTNAKVYANGLVKAAPVREQVPVSVFPSAPSEPLVGASFNTDDLPF